MITMKKLILVLLIGLGVVVVASETRRGSHTESSESALVSHVVKTTPDRVCRNMYSSQVIILTDDQPIYITVQLESVVHVAGKKVEFQLRLWEVDKLLTTKRVSVNW